MIPQRTFQACRLVRPRDLSHHSNADVKRDKESCRKVADGQEAINCYSCICRRARARGGNLWASYGLLSTGLKIPTILTMHTRSLTMLAA